MFQGISTHQNQDDRQEDAQNLRQVLHQVYLSQHKTIPYINTQLNYSLSILYEISQIQNPAQK